MRPSAWAATAFIILGAMGWAATRPNADHRRSPDRLVRALNADVGTLDPHRATSLEDNSLAADLSSGLLAIGPDGSLVPGLAAAWTVDREARTYRFVLRRKLRWSDGSPLTADDVVASFRRAVSPGTAAPYASYLYPIVNAEAVNDGALPPASLAVRAVTPHVIEIRLARPTPYFLQTLALPIGAVVAVGAPKRGSGPFVLTERRPLFGLVLNRNPYFHGARSVAFSGVDYIVIESASAAIRRYEAGEIDVIEDVPLNQIPRLRRQRPDELHFDRLRGLYYFTLNVEDRALADRRIRQALDLAIDRGALVDAILRAGDLPAEGIVPPGTQGARLCQARADRRPQGAAAARAILARAGYGRGRPLRLELRYNSNDTHRRVALVAARFWKDAGIETRLLSTDFRVHYNDLAAGKYQVARAGWTANIDDPFMFFDLVRGGADSNDSRYANPDVDALIAEAGSTTDAARRAALYCRAEQLVRQDVPIIPLFHPAKRSLVSLRIGGWADNGRSTRASYQLHRRPIGAGDAPLSTSKSQ